MRAVFIVKIFIFSFGLLLSLSACSVLGATSAEVTPTPEPTSSISNMQVVQPQACQVAEQGMIRVEHPQGDLISWSPVDDTVAYIGSIQGSSWNVGDLKLLAAPKFDAPETLVAHVAGELTWSPDGSSIAYLGLRQSDNLYTIGLAYPDGRPYKDLFPAEAARTDDYSSQKLIIGWIDADRLRVYVSCGVDCLQAEDIDVESDSSTPNGVSIERFWDMWAVHTNHPAVLPSDYANLPGQLNWSPDEKHVAYIDAQGNAWVIITASNSFYPLDIGQYGTATETDWSYDSEYLAVQVDQNLKIFSLKCP